MVAERETLEVLGKQIDALRKQKVAIEEAIVKLEGAYSALKHLPIGGIAEEKKPEVTTKKLTTLPNLNVGNQVDFGVGEIDIPHPVKSPPKFRSGQKGHAGRIYRFLESLTEPMTVEEIMECLSMSNTQVRSSIATLKNRNLILEIRRIGHKFSYIVKRT